MGTSAYRLKDGVSFCLVDGRAVFLDTEQDRYFRLSPSLEQAFDAHVAGRDVPAEAVARLIEKNILTTAPHLNSASASLEDAHRSALELPSPPDVRCLNDLPSLLAILCATQFRLKTRPLKSILHGMVAVRAMGTDHRVSEQRLVHEVQVFLKGRKLIPIGTCCLLDSVSMVTFLARRGLSTNLVFGVTTGPFTAHCWVQARDMVLNDALGNIRAYTPIRVV